MRVLFFSPYATWAEHFEVTLELALRYGGLGDECHAVYCNAEMPGCEANLRCERMVCMMCRSRAIASYGRVGLPSGRMHPLGVRSTLPPESLPDFRDLTELKAFSWNGLDVGLSVASSLISRLHDTNPDLRGHQAYIKSLVSTSVGVCAAMGEHLDRIRPELVIVFNGRFSFLRAAVSAARQRGIRVRFHDRGQLMRYLMFDGCSAHDISFLNEDIKRVSGRMDEDRDGSELAARWYENSRAGRTRFVYIDGQVKGVLPAGFDSQKTNIAVFSSSPYEVAAIPGWENPIYGTQQKALESIFSALNDGTVHFYLRVHPHLRGMDNQDRRDIARLSGSNLSVIEPESQVDSYSLMEACDKVLSFGSTIGIEAVYWGKPSILAGRSIYEDLGACYRPGSHEELVAMLRARLEPRPRELALRYGYWLSKGGEPFEHLQPCATAPGARYKGVPFKASLWSRLLFKAARMTGTRF